MNINIIVLQGRLTKDPEMKDVDFNGKILTIAKFSVATNHYTKNKDVPKVSFFEVEAIGHSAKFLGEYCSKGDLLLIKGELEQQRWKDKEGNDRNKIKIKSMDVQLLSKKGDNKKESSSEPGVGYSARENEPDESAPPLDIDEEFPDGPF